MNKIETINKIFDGYEIRGVWNKITGDYYFSVIYVIGSLTNGKRDRKYWSDLKKKLKDEGSQLSEKIGQLKLKSYMKWKLQIK